MKTDTKTFDPNKSFKTRNGKEVKILTFIGEGNYPIIGYVKNDNGGWQTVTCWSKEGYSFNSVYNNLVNEPDPPTYIPLDADDILPGDIVRRIPCYSDEQSHKWALIYSVNKTSVYLGNHNNSFSYTEIMKNYEISHDRGKTWEKCQKEAN
jgi:hypothetical protein